MDPEATRAAGASAAWFHELAGLGHDEIARRCSPQALARLQAHVAICLTGCVPPAALSPAQFAETVLDLQASEHRWHGALMAAVIRADDQALAGQVEEAQHTLHAFAQVCPWVPFQAAARGQAALLQG